MFYIIESEYVGPNEKPNSHQVFIQTVPGKTNSSHQERINGWLGTTNDWAEYAHGEYETIEEARAAINEKFGPCRDEDLTWHDPDTVVESYLVGEFEQLGKEATKEWCYHGFQYDICSTTTDAELADIVEQYCDEANNQNLELHHSILSIAEDYRQELIDNEEITD